MKGSIIIYNTPKKPESEVLIVDKHGKPLIVQQNRPIGFVMKGENHDGNR